MAIDASVLLNPEVQRQLQDRSPPAADGEDARDVCGDVDLDAPTDTEWAALRQPVSEQAAASPASPAKAEPVEAVEGDMLCSFLVDSQPAEVETD